MVKMSRNPEMRRLLHLAIVDDEESWDDTAIDKAHSKVCDLMTMEKNAQAAYRTHGERFPTATWHCCRTHCFATIAMDPQQILLLDELIFNHDYANRCHVISERISSSVRRRRRGTATSTVAFASSSRAVRGIFWGTAGHGASVNLARVCYLCP